MRHKVSTSSDKIMYCIQYMYIHDMHSLSVQLFVDLVQPAEAGLVPAGEAVVEVDEGVVLLHILVQRQENVPD